MGITLPLLLVTLGLLVAFLIVIMIIVKWKGSTIGERKISEREVMAEITKEQFHSRRPF